MRLASIENDGQVSVIREDWAEPLQKGDVRAAAGEQGEARRQETIPAHRTDSPSALG